VVNVTITLRVAIIVYQSKVFQNN